MLRMVLAVASILPVANLPADDSRPMGEIVTWLNTYPDLPAGSNFVAVAGGYYYQVAVRADGTLAAWLDPVWGDPELLNTLPQGNDFVDVAPCQYWSAALRSDGSVVHWGAFRPDVPPGSYTAITSGSGHWVGLRDDGSLASWGYWPLGSGVLPAPPEGDDFVAISSAETHNLALRSDGSIVSWGQVYDNVSSELLVAPAPPVGNDFVKISASTRFGVAIRSDGSLTAWGLQGYYGNLNVPEGNDFVDVSAHHDGGYALRADGTLTAWGQNAIYNPPPGGSGFVALGKHFWNNPGLAIRYVPPPAADAGPDQSVHCDGYDGAEVLLDGSFSYDPDEDDLRYEWSVAEWSGIVLEDPTSPVTAGLFPIGVHEVTLTVYDVDEYGADIGGTDSDSVIITVYDDDPPVAMVTTDVATLFPANGDMLPVTIYVEASDYCTAPNALDIFCYVSSDQPDPAGNANRTGDVDGFDGYTEPVEVSLTNVDDGLYETVIWLRAERVSTARTYSIGLMVEDASGNFGEASTTVVVPHDRRRN